MTSTSTYYSKSMNGVMTITDGVSTLENGELSCSQVVCNNLYTDSFQASLLTDGYCQITNGNITGVNALSCNSLNSTIINSSTLNSNIGNIKIINASTTNISTINSSNISSINASFLNVSVTGILNVTNLNTQNIQAPTTTANTSLYTNSTGVVNLGGVGGVNIANNGSIYTKISSTPLTCNLDFKTSTFVNSYDTRIQGTGGTSALDGTGTLNLIANTINLTTTSQTGKTFITKNGNYSLEAGITTNTAYLDFHSSNTTSDYDARIITTGGSSSNGQGTLDITANTINLNGTVNNTGVYSVQSIQAPTPSSVTNIFSNNTSTINFGGTGVSNFNASVNNLISSTTNISSPTINLNTYRFRFVPWTTYYGGTTLANNVISYPTGTSCPTSGTGAILKYRYSVIGNTIYLNYFYGCSATGTAGSGSYQYVMPTGYTIDLTDINNVNSAELPTAASGTIIGRFYFRNRVSGTRWAGNCYVGNLNGNGIIVTGEVHEGSTSSIASAQGSGAYSYNTTDMVCGFEAMVPIN